VVKEKTASCDCDVDLIALGVFVVSPERLQVFLTVEAADFAKKGVLISAKSAQRVDRSAIEA
jgi:hypothetical protein